MIIDEFADIITNKELGRMFATFLNRCRGSGIGFVIAHQSLGDFESTGVQTQILDATETLISFVQKDPQSCDILAGIAGTEEVYKTTEQTEASLLFDERTGRGSRVLTQEYLFHPNEFKNLDVGEAIYMAKKPTRYSKVKMIQYDLPSMPYNSSIASSINRLEDNPRKTFTILKECFSGYENVRGSSSNNEVPKDFKI